MSAFYTKGLSMDPLLREGDLIFAEPVKEEDIYLGDIVAFKSAGQQDIIAHRVVRILNKQKRKLYLVQADFSDKLGLEEINFKDIIGKVVGLKREERLINLKNGYAKILQAIWNRFPQAATYILPLLKWRSICFKLNFLFNPRFFIRSPERSLESIRLKFDETEEVKFHQEYFKQGMEEWEETVASRYFHSGSRILDIGCGAGREAIALAERGCQVVGIDISPQMVMAARQECNRRNLSVRFEVMSASDIEFPESYFDYCIFSHNVYSFIPSRQLRIKSLKLIRKCLRAGGLIFLNEDIMGKPYFVSGQNFLDIVRRARNLIFPGIFSSQSGDIWRRGVSPKSNLKTFCFFHQFYSEKEIQDEINDAGFKFLRNAWEGVFIARNPERESIKGGPIENSLILSCIRYNRDDPSKEFLPDNTSLSEIDWDRFLDRANKNKIGGLVYKNFGSLKNIAGIVPENILKTLKASYYATASRNTLFLNIIRDLIEDFQKQGIEVIVFKGLILAELCYGDIGLRPMTDIDILVKKAEVKKIDGLLKSKGYQIYFNSQEFTEFNTGRCHNSFFYYHPDSESFLHIHWHMINFSLHRKSVMRSINIDEVWREAERSALTDFEVFTPSIYHHLIYLCLHGMAHSFDPLIRLSDIDRFVNANKDKIDMDMLLKQANDYGVTRYVYYALYLSKKILHTDISEVLLKKLKPAKISLFESNYIRAVLKGQAGTAHYLLALLGMNENLKNRLIYTRDLLFPSKTELALIKQKDPAAVSFRDYAQRLSSTLSYIFKSL